MKRMKFLVVIVLTPVLVAIASALLLFGYFNLPGPAPSSDVSLGITFSARYATDLGVDWREAYLAMLDDLGVRRVRIPVYWDLVEQESGIYDFSEIDWMLDEAAKRGAETILAIGQREPRWPECHIPEWVRTEGNDAYREARLSDFIAEVVTRYRSRGEVSVWQVENEPFVTFFGECPPLSRDFFDKEIAYVKALDPTRPVLVTDSGEFSTWISAALRGDILGTTMYRKVFNPDHGYITYPIGPNYYRLKAALIRLITGRDRFIVAELQAEPWAAGWVGDASIEEQYLTMNPELLLEYVDYARRVGFSEAYLWGAEWWYWLKEAKGDSAVWEAARTIFGGGRTAVR